MSNSHRIDVEPISLGQGGQLYSVRHDGAVLVASSRNPEFDACRLLLDKGIYGKVEVWHKDGTFPSMRLDIEKGARLTVEESDRVGPRFVRWYPRSEQAATNAVSSSAVSPRAAKNEIPVGRWPPQKDRPENQPARANIESEGWLRVGAFSVEAAEPL